MKVILIKKVDKLGLPGEVKEIADGYARNFLMPNKLAVIATEKVINDWRNKVKAKKDSLKNEVNKAKKLAKELSKVKLEIKAKANEDGKLFGAITDIQIMENLKKRKIELAKKYLNYQEPIKNIGEYEVGFKLADGSIGKFKVIVTTGSSLGN